MSTENNGTDEAAPAQDREVRVGDRTVIVGRFRGYKATKMMQEAAAIGRRYPKIGKDLAAFKQAYGDENQIALDRAAAEFKLGEAAREISDKAWDSSGGVIRLRKSPTFEEQIVAIFPDLFEHAQQHVVRLLALVAASNSELREAYDDGDDAGVDRMLEQRGRDLLFEADAEELLDLALAGVEVGKAQFAPMRERLGKLMGQLGLQTAPTTETAPDPATTAKPSASPTTPPRSETRPPSSTDSPAPTAGPPTPSSSVSPGSRSEASPIA
jgi:hypothetical protein